tara:strand:- start:37 stop:867 length:831 start_codon:yes stop_codon:yes gene_type:complete
MTAFVQHKGFNPRLLSSRIWGRLPIKNWSVGLGGRYFFDDFMNHPAHISAQSIGNYASYIDTGVTLKQAAGEATGALEIAGNDADNDEGSISTGGNSGGMVAIDASGTGRIAFECRFKKSTIGDNSIAFFLGLAEEGLAAQNTLVDDTGVLASKDFIGFRNRHDDSDSTAGDGAELDFVWRKAGQATQEHANIHTLVADTYVKMGFLYDPGNHPDDKKIKIYVDNGEEESVYVTQTQLDAATFPDDEELCLLFATKTGAAATVTAHLDWWALGVEE